MGASQSSEPVIPAKQEGEEGGGGDKLGGKVASTTSTAAELEAEQEQQEQESGVKKSKKEKRKEKEAREREKALKAAVEMAAESRTRGESTAGSASSLTAFAKAQEDAAKKAEEARGATIANFAAESKRVDLEDRQKEKERKKALEKAAADTLLGNTIDQNATRSKLANKLATPNLWSCPWPGTAKKLLAATKEGDMEVIEEMVLTWAGHSIINCRDEDGNCPLLFCTHRQDLKSIELLLRAGANVNQMSDDGNTPVNYTAKKGFAKTLEFLLCADPNVDIVDNDGWNSIYSAVYRDSERCLELLIGAKGDINRINKQGQTPLWFAANNNREICAKQLITAGAEINKPNREGNSPLYAAAFQGSEPIVSALIAGGADVNQGNFEVIKRRPLYAAETAKKARIVTILQAAGAR